MHCLAPNCNGDGTGCDNMTCIIVSLRTKATAAAATTKRPLSEEEKTDDESTEKQEDSAAKKQKKDRDGPQQISTESN